MAKPLLIKFSSAVLSAKVPAAPATPIVVLAVRGCMVKVFVPVIAPAKVMSSVVRVRL